MRGDHRVSPLSTTLRRSHRHVELRDLWHRFDGAGQSWTLKGIDLKLAAGELLGLLGPSGCGKTTLLRLIAGFERPSRGSVHLQQGLVAGDGRWVPPERRGVGMVFQDYALFPHLSAWRNACFGLRPGQDVSRARWLLELLGLADLEERFPHQLSGGQRQRLALARALAPAPAVVLMDEPLSNLDVEVRLRLRGELTSVLKLCGASGLIVTHDPGEALAICDRVAVMKDGRFDQCWPTIVRTTLLLWVALFCGQSAAGDLPLGRHTALRPGFLAGRPFRPGGFLRGLGRCLSIQPPSASMSTAQPKPV